MNFLDLDLFWFEINYGATLIAQNENSNVLYHMATYLQNSLKTNTTGTQIFVGHDTNIDGVGGLLDLTWPSPPYPLNATSPGSALRLDLHKVGDGHEIRASFLSTTFIDTRGHLTITPALFTQTRMSRIDLNSFMLLVSNSIDKKCTSN